MLRDLLVGRPYLRAVATMLSLTACGSEDWISLVEEVPSDIAWVGPRKIAVGTQFGVEPDEGAGIDQFLAQPVILLLGAIAPHDFFRFHQFGRLGHPFLQAFVSNYFWNHHLLFSFIDWNGARINIRDYSMVD